MTEETADLTTKDQMRTALVLLRKVLHGLPSAARGVFDSPTIPIIFGHQTWAHFPIRKPLRAKLGLEPQARILFELSGKEAAEAPDLFVVHTAHHVGHVLCYLTNGRWIHHCPDADAMFDQFLRPGQKNLRRQIARGIKRAEVYAEESEKGLAEIFPEGVPRSLDRWIKSKG